MCEKSKEKEGGVGEFKRGGSKSKQVGRRRRGRNNSK